MKFAWQILIHTPVWVFPLFGYLVWLGIKAMRPRTVTIWRSLIVPAVFIVDPKRDRLANGQSVIALADARSMTPQGIADWLARWVK